jgi:predicted ester cyclase
MNDGREGEMTSIEENKALVRRIHEDLESAGRLELADALFAPTVRSSHRPDRPPGPAGVKRHIAMLRAAFPDLAVTIEDLVAEGDRVAARLTMRGTHLGEFRCVSPTGRSVVWTGLVLRRIAGGRVVEQWSQFDTTSLLAQLQPSETGA